MRYEGFEPSPYGHDSARENELETVRFRCLAAVLPDLCQQSDAQHPGPSHTPIFDIGRVQYSLPAPLVSLVVASDVLAMGLSSNTIVFIELAHSDQEIKIPIPRKPTEFSIYKLFLDPSGRHLIVTSIEGENWYLFRGWKKPKQLKTFKMVIESVAWNKAALLSSSHLTSTREILIGARNGTIYEAILDAEEDFFKSQERYLNAVFSLPERQAITGLNFDFFPSIDPKKVLVVVITTSRIYQFTGTLSRRLDDGGRVFGLLFAASRETAPSTSLRSSVNSV
jgi:vacuolar protein sorting-associated protein 18